MKYLFNLEIYSWLASMVEMQVIYCVNLFLLLNLIYMSCLSFSYRLFIVCSQLYIFLTNRVFTYICASFWLFCC
jgi:hypothetical protein